MGNNQKHIEVVDEETGEVFNLDPQSLVSNVRDILLSRRRMQLEATIWSKLKEADQKDEITAMQELARDLVGKVVEVVAEKGLVCAHVAIQKFAVDVDKGIVQITSSGYASDQMLTDLAHSKGKVAKLTIVDERQFNEKSTLVVADKDQPSLLPDDADQAADENDHVSDEDMYQRAVIIIKAGQKCSVSYIQRKLWIGYDKTAKFIERMENEGIVSAASSVGKRDVLVDADSMDEPDDLHDTSADGPMPDPVSDEKVQGHYDRMQGLHSQRNPFDINTKDREEWYLGWKEADRAEGAPEVDETLDVKVKEQPDQSGAGDAEPQAETQADDLSTDQGDNDPDLGDLTPMQHGQQARLKDVGPDDNPFDGGTDGYNEWAGGYDAADAEIKTLIEAGRKSGADGDEKKKCPWKKGTDGERFWLQGWEAGKSDA